MMVTLNATLSDEDLREPLREVRLSIIGDDDEKLALLHSPNLAAVFQIMAQIISGERQDPAILEHLLIIIYSLSLRTESLPIMVHDRALFTVLIRVANKFKDNDAVLVNIFNILSVVLSTRRYFNLDLMSADGMLFKNLLYQKLNETAEPNYDWITKRNRVLQGIFSLIPHLNASDLKSLIPQSLKILQVVMKAPLSALLKSYGAQKIYTECYDRVFVPSPPKMILFSNFTGPLLFSLAHMLCQEQELHMNPVTGSSKVNIAEVLDKEHYFVISSLLKAQDPELKLASINLLVNYSLSSDLTEGQKSVNVKKLLPYLVQLINLEDSNNFTVYKSHLNLSRKFNPFDILSRLSLHFEFVNDFLLNCNIIVKFCEIVCKLGKLGIQSLSLQKLDNLASVFLILSCVTATDESNRIAILNDDLIHTIESVLKFHNDGLHQCLVNSNDLDESGLLASNHLAVSACYLLRSFSRSISTLRTRLQDTSIVTFLLDTISIPEHELTLQLGHNFILLQNEILLKTVALAIVSNIILDFSPLRKDLLSGGLVDIIADLLRTTESRSILLNSLWVLRHLVYNEMIDTREKFMTPIGLANIIGFCNHADLQIRVMAFNVLRNLTTNSVTHVMQLLNFFRLESEDPTSEEAKQSWLNFLLVKMKSSPMDVEANYELLEAIVYVVVHIAIIDDDCRDLIVRNVALMEEIRELLLHCNNDGVKLACIWVLINLTWVENVQQRSGESAQHTFGDFRRAVSGDVDIEDTSDVRGFEANTIDDQSGRLRDLRSLRSGRTTSSTSARVAALRELGFQQVLAEVLQQSGDNIDFSERLKVALNNFQTLGRGAGSV